MQGLKIQCPNCKRKDFVTTEKFNPNVTPNGSFVKCTLPYHIEWLTSSVTLGIRNDLPGVHGTTGSAWHSSCSCAGERVRKVL